VPLARFCKPGLAWQKQKIARMGKAEVANCGSGVDITYKSYTYYNPNGNMRCLLGVSQ